MDALNLEVHSVKVKPRQASETHCFKRRRRLTELEAAPHGGSEIVAAHGHQIRRAGTGASLLHVRAGRSLVVHDACPAITAQSQQESRRGHSSSKT